MALVAFALVQARVPLGILQGYAWTRMYVEFRETFDSADAAWLTFSGEEICGICEAVDRLHELTEDVPALASALEQVVYLPFGASVPHAFGLPPSQDWRWGEDPRRGTDWSGAPPTPPPRKTIDA